MVLVILKLKTVSMNKISYILPILLLVLASCQKEVQQTTGAVKAQTELSARSGSFVAYVETEGVWSAEALEDWLHVDQAYHKDHYAVEVEYDSNESVPGYMRFNRMGHVVIRTYDGFAADTLVVKQRGSVPVLSFAEVNLISAEGGDVSVPFTTNLSDRERPYVRLTTDSAWIKDPVWGRDGVSVSFTAEAGSSREGTVTVTYTDGWGQVTASVCRIRQE